MPPPAMATPLAPSAGDPLYDELWRACAGPLVTVPRVGDLVFYFPQGHIEQVGHIEQGNRGGGEGIAIMFRRAVGSLLPRRFSPRATPRTAPVRFLHSPPSCFSSRSTQTDLSIGDGLRDDYVFVACVSAGACAGLVIRHFKKGTGVDGSAFGKLNHNVKFKKPDMKERFERWIVVSGKTYRDEEEKAMRFELFKVALENVESQLPPVEESGVLPGVPCRFPFAAPLFGFSKELYHNRSLALQFQWTCMLNISSLDKIGF